MNIQNHLSITTIASLGIVVKTCVQLSNVMFNEASLIHANRGKAYGYAKPLIANKYCVPGCCYQDLSALLIDMFNDMSLIQSNGGTAYEYAKPFIANNNFIPGCCC